MVSQLAHSVPSASPAPPQESGASRPDNLSARLPLSSMWPDLAGYALFATGYIVYITFLVAWMQSLRAESGLIATTWIMVGLSIIASPFVWRGVLARFDNGIPLALATSVTALGMLLPLLWSTPAGLIASGVLFGISVFIAPAAVTAFSRKNLVRPVQASGIALFTVVFAAGQTFGPVAAGAIGDAFGSIRYGLGAASAITALGAVIALSQPALPETSRVD